MLPLDGYRVVSLTVNLPGPLAASRLREFGASVTKVEPPEGDPLWKARPRWYDALCEGQYILRLNLREPHDLKRLHERLAKADLLLSALRPAALERLRLDWKTLHGVHPLLSHIAIVGYDAPETDRPGHDLTYQARCGLVTPPGLPRTLIADLAGGQEAATAGMALLLARQRGQGAGFTQVSLSSAAQRFAAPIDHTLTSSGGILGGGTASYNVYPARDGWVAVAALERHFVRRLADELNLEELTAEALSIQFRRRSATEWEAWAVARDLPLVAVRGSRDVPEEAP